MKGFRIAFFSIVFLSSIFFVGIVNARGGTFIIEPSEKANERVKLGACDTVRGNFSVSNGFIDFYIMSPSGTVFLRYNKTAFDIFNFTAEEDGNYSMHLINAYQTENVNVTLNYAVHVVINLYGEINVVQSVETSTVISAPLPIPDPDPKLDDPYRKYLNFLKAHEILRIATSAREYMPLQNSLLVFDCVALAVVCIALATGTLEIVRLVRRRPVPTSRTLGVETIH
ncbi:MAG: emp24/gp25L/p24 family protein [Candidatus Bathyarchaeota archaeon]|nr:emp24/gp25L/p24 family protein [Candidatus Bathyarchaeota archaeon]